MMPQSTVPSIQKSSHDLAPFTVSFYLLGNLAWACPAYWNDHTSMEKLPYHSTARGSDSCSTS
jgi:hypothetical protein